MILSYPESRQQSQDLARELGCGQAEIVLHRFPDGESRVTLPDCGEDHVVLLRSLDRPNDKLVELMLAAKALRERGARRLTLIAPYLCYMRQDTIFHHGEVVSQKIIGGLLASLFDELITVDPHLHRVERLEQAVPVKRAIALSAAPLFARHLREQGCEWLLMGPDAESEQWVGAIASQCGMPHAVATKQRLSDRNVEIRLPEVPVQGRRIMLTDDIISTGSTLARAAELLQAQGAREIRVLVTHALFTGDAVELLSHSGIAAIGSSDSITHPSNIIALVPMLAEAVRSLD